MDPLTAFSLACGVIQVVDFSTRTVDKCIEIYKEGSAPEYRDLEDLTKHLVDARTELDLSDANQSVGSFSTPNERKLLEVAGQCSKTADELVEKLRSLKTEGPHKKRQAIRKTVKMLREKGEMKEIQKRLDGYRSALDTQILTNLRQRLNSTSLHVQSLDTKMQTLIHSFSQGSKFEELKDLIQMKNQTLGEQFNSTFQKHERRQEEKEYRRQLLDSLWFAEILSREEMIEEAHSKTFQWIFDQSGQTVRPWDNFSAWLENGEGIYWINGKAGSGKSTLMSFLCQDERTIEALKVWAETKVPLMPTFYFWSSGTTMQKSFEGLLRSLLWQILKESPNTTVLPVTFASLPEQNKCTALGRGSIGAWTKHRLQRTLQEAINQLQSSYRLCFFLDGLDEFDDHDELITFVRDIVSKTGAKICLSSRPYKIFEDAFSFSAKLRLQDLTHTDVQRYVKDKFQDVPLLVSMTSKNENEMKELKDEIVARAEGVFLWVKLAVKDQIRGLRNDDSPEQLQERLACLPSEIEGIYHRMLLQIDKPHQREASYFLRMALHRPQLSLLGHVLGSYKDLEAMLSSDSNEYTQKIPFLCQLTPKKINTRCAGLLELHEPSNRGTMSETAGNWTSGPDSRQFNTCPRDETSACDFKGEIVDDSKPEKENGLQNLKAERPGQSSGSKSEIIDAEILKLHFHTRVSFIHRTAVDFLKTTGPGRKFLEDYSPSEFNLEVFSIKASLGILRLLGPMSHSENDDREFGLGSIDSVMKEVANAEDRAGSPQTRLCELVDRTMSISDSLHSKWRPNSHWCMRWGLLARISDREEAYTTSSSRSNSTDSFASTTSRFPSPDLANVTPTDPIRFLGFAASHNLVHYVQHVLDRREESVSPETLDYLLGCSISAYRFRSGSTGGRYSSEPLKVVRELLRRGANANARYFGKTIWREFLERTVALWAHDSLTGYPMWLIENYSQVLTSSIIAFIENGADMSAIWTFHLYLPTGLRTATHSSRYGFDMQLSALSAIRLVLRHTPDFPRIQEMCVAKGALLHSKCTIYKVTAKAHWEESSDLKEYELCERESEELGTILEQFASTMGEDHWKNFCRQLPKFSERLDVICSDNSNSSHMRTSIARESTQGSKWYTHKSFLDPNTFVSRHWLPAQSHQYFYDAPSSPPQSHDSDGLAL